MIICSCNALSDGDVRACLNPSPNCPRSPAQIYRCLGCGPKCGRCAATIRSIMDKALADAHACSNACASACPLDRRAGGKERVTA